MRSIVYDNAGANLIRCLLTSLLFLVSVLVSPAMAQGAGETSESSFWLWALLGRFHPMIVHFPISLLFVALLFEIITWKRKSNNYQPAIQLLIVVGAISSVVAVVFGLLLSSSGEYGSEILPVHQWTGIATMVLSSITVIAGYKQAHQVRRTLLIITVIGVTVTGHYGALLTHGDDYLSSVLPNAGSGESVKLSESLLTATDGKLTEVQIQEINLQVRTILAHHCYKCHGKTKVKGELRLDTKEHIFDGGEDGVVLIPGNPGKSEIIRRIRLPRSHKDAMPEKGKGLSAEEIAVLTFWIKQGAPWPEGPEKSLYRVAALEPRTPDLPESKENLTNPIDRFVNAYFEKNEYRME